MEDASKDEATAYLAFIVMRLGESSCHRPLVVSPHSSNLYP